MRLFRLLRHGEEGEKEGKEESRCKEGQLCSKRIPLSDARPSCTRRGPGHRVLQEGSWRKGEGAHARPRRQDNARRSRDRRLAHHAWRGEPPDEQPLAAVP